MNTPRPFHIRLTRDTGALTGTLHLGETEFPLTCWQQGGDPGHVNARSGPMQITITIWRAVDGDRIGAMTISETNYALRGVVVDGLEITGVAEVVRDPFWESWRRAYG